MSIASLAIDTLVAVRARALPSLIPAAAPQALDVDRGERPLARGQVGASGRGVAVSASIAVVAVREAVSQRRLATTFASARRADQLLTLK